MTVGCNRPCQGVRGLWVVRKAVGSIPSSSTTVMLQALRGAVTGRSAAARLALTVLPELFVPLRMC